MDYHLPQHSILSTSFLSTTTTSENNNGRKYLSNGQSHLSKSKRLRPRTTQSPAPAPTLDSATLTTSSTYIEIKKTNSSVYQKKKENENENENEKDTCKESRTTSQQKITVKPSAKPLTPSTPRSQSTLSNAYRQQQRAISKHDECTAQDEECCGWLWMKSSRIGLWKYRYFSLQGSMLTYFEKYPSTLLNTNNWSNSFFQIGGYVSEKPQPRGVVRVAHVEESAANKFGFKVYGSCGKIIDIRAPKSSLRNIWLHALHTKARRKTRAWSGGEWNLFEDKPTHPKSLSEYYALAYVGASSTPGQATEHEKNNLREKFELQQECESSILNLSSMDERLSIPIIKSGWMRKKSDFLKRWNRYFFVLQGGMLSYYLTNKPYDVPRRRGYIRKVCITTSNRHKILAIELDCKSSSIYAQPEDAIEIDSWYARLQTCMQYRNMSPNRTQPTGF